MSEETSSAGARGGLGPQAAARVWSAIDADPSPGEWGGGEGRGLPEGYLVERVIGSGGGGVVYRAFREGSDRPVALKVLRAGGAAAGADGSAWSRRAWRELQLLQDLHLAVLPRVLDYGVLPGGRLFIATEFIEGQRLDEATRGFADSSPACESIPAAPKRRIDLALLLAKACDAAQVLHEHGVIHRDLKPSNIMIDAHGEPVLIDLGIAALVEPASGGVGDPTITETGAPLGTPAYMAPEQARGERERVSTRSDVYALGATAYRLFTGSTPHDTATTIHEAIRRVAFDEPRDPRSLDPSLPKSLAAVLLKACARAPEKRYASAAEFGADLRRWARGEAVEAMPQGAWQRMVRWAGRHPIATTAAVCAAIVTVSIGGTWMGILWLRNEPADLIVAGERSRAVLISRTGDVLKEWQAGREDGVCFRAFIPRLHTTGEARAFFAMLDSTAAEFESSIVAVDPGSREIIRVVGPSTIGLVLPPRFTERRGVRFMIQGGVVADVFPDTPDPEIMTWWYHFPMSPTAFVVFDLDLTPLSTTWHDGGISSIVWMKQAGIVVAAGVNSERSWCDLGFGGLKDIWPGVAFAFRPPRQGIHLIVGEGTRPDGEVLRWYRCIWPPDEQDLLGDPRVFREQAPHESADAIRLVRDLRPGASTGSVSWVINADGCLSDMVESDSFRRAVDEGRISCSGKEMGLVDWARLTR